MCKRTANLPNDLVQPDRLGHIDAHLRPNFERLKTGERLNAGENLRVGFRTVKMPGMSSSLKESPGGDLGIAGAVNVNRLIRKIREPLCWGS